MAFERNFEELRSAITETRAAWEAGRTDFAAMSERERRLLLGYTPDPDDPLLEESERMARVNLEALRSAADKAFGYPASYDLRNVGGANYLTPVKYQGDCGSSVSFGAVAAVAAVEGRMRRQRDDPNLAVDRFHDRFVERLVPVAGVLSWMKFTNRMAFETTTPIRSRPGTDVERVTTENSISGSSSWLRRVVA